MTKVAVVTGSNKGVGLATVQGLARKFDGDVFLTARSEERGKESLEKLKKEGLGNVHFHQLDIDDKESIERLRDFLKKNYGGIDVLVNNAAIAFKQDAIEPFGQQAKVTVATNYFSTKQACDILFEILKPGARVVNVSSMAGWLAKMITDGPLKQKLASPDLTVPELDALMNQFIEAAAKGDHVAKGWPNSTYVVSKVGLSALSVIQQREFDKKPELDLVVNHVHPGYVDTDMTSHKGPRTIEEGARSSIFGALLPPKTEIRGKFIWEDCTLRDWIKGE